MRKLGLSNLTKCTQFLSWDVKPGLLVPTYPQLDNEQQFSRQLVIGYWNNVELSSLKFVKDESTIWLFVLFRFISFFLDLGTVSPWEMLSGDRDTQYCTAGEICGSQPCRRIFRAAC